MWHEVLREKRFVFLRRQLPLNWLPYKLKGLARLVERAYGPFYAVSESVVVNADLSTCVPGEDFHRGSLVDLHLRIAPDGAC